MAKKKRTFLAVVVLIVVAAAASLTTLAVTNYGTESDPLVTLSYLEDRLTPEILDELESSLAAKEQELTEEFQDLISQSGGTVGTDTFSVITLEAGDILSCSVGTEIMPRIGTVVSAGPDSPRLIDETTGSSVTSAGTELETNHMYMVTIVNNGIEAETNAKVLIRGDYTIE